AKEKYINSPPTNDSFPHYTVDNTVNSVTITSWEMVGSETWIVGFLPGNYWELYKFTKDSEFKTRAIKTQEKIKFRQNTTNSHDIGFVFMHSYKKALDDELTSGNNTEIVNEYTNVLLTAAASLASRFQPTVGAIRSWDNKLTTDENNMMNLDLLFYASQLPGGQKEWFDIATSHAFTTMKHLIRPNYSTYHLVIFDSTKKGSVIKNMTWQGYSDSSTWSRGQAWGVYGFLKAYQYTKNRDFLETSINLANYFISRLSNNSFVAKWDFDAPGSGADFSLQDSSATAILNTALIDLVEELTALADTRAQKFEETYRHVYSYLEIKKTDYFDPKKPSLMLHGTSNGPKNLKNQGLIYGDMYLLEGLNKIVTQTVQTSTIYVAETTSKVANSGVLISAKIFAVSLITFLFC
ncbi:hypothetical protein HK099_000871, partial [Clydaea vesicula]